MKKLILKESQKEVKEGDIVVQSLITPYGHFPLNNIEVTKENLPSLIAVGVIEEVEEMPQNSKKVNKTNREISITIDTCVGNLAHRIRWNKDNLYKYLDTLYTISPAAVFSIILKEIAILLDQKYSNHIENSKEVWSISLSYGEICKIQDIHKVKNFRNFAAFRTLEDALEAKEVMSEAMDDLFAVKKGLKSAEK